MSVSVSISVSVSVSMSIIDTIIIIITIILTALVGLDFFFVCTSGQWFFSHHNPSFFALFRHFFFDDIKIHANEHIQINRTQSVSKKARP